MNANAFIKVDKATFYRFIATDPEGRYEFVKGRIMQQQQGGTKRHGSIAGRFAQALRNRLAERDWSVIEGRGVETTETVRYADVVVEPADEPDESLATLRPALIVEVLSPTSGDRDLDVKPAEYMGLASLHAYIVASSNGPECYLWVRDSGTFCSDPVALRGAESSIDVPALGLTIPLAEIYRD